MSGLCRRQAAGDLAQSGELERALVLERESHDGANLPGGVVDRERHRRVGVDRPGARSNIAAAMPAKRCFQQRPSWRAFLGQSSSLSPRKLHNSVTVPPRRTWWYKACSEQ